MVVGLISSGAMAATAAPTPEPATSVYPSQEDVDAARAAVDTAQMSADQLEAAYRDARTRLASIQHEESRATEAYNRARLDLDVATQQSQEAAERASTAGAAADDAQRTVRRYAAQMYTDQGSLTGVEAFLGGGGPQEVADRSSALQTLSDARSQALADASHTANLADEADRLAAHSQDQLETAAAQAVQSRDAAAAASQAAQAQAAAIGAQQDQVLARLAELRATSVDTERARQEGLAAAAAAEAEAQRAAAERAAAEAAAAAAAEESARAEAQRQAEAAAAREQQAREAAAAAAAAAATAAPAPVIEAPVAQPAAVVTPVSSGSGGMSTVIAYAQAQLGKPYIWGGEGPTGYDCSGLAMMAYRQIGIYLPHGSQAQYNMGTKVPISQARPGDLVFFGASGPTNYHVGIYVGDGMMINALNSRTPIRYDSIYYLGDLVPYAARF